MDVRRDAESTRSEGVFTEVVFFLGTEDMPSSTDLFIGSHIYRIFIEEDVWLIEWNLLKFATFKFKIGVGFHSVVVWSRWCRTASS